LDPEGDCLVCKNLKGRIIYRLPCLRYKISDTKLLDKGPHPRFSWTQRWKSMEIVEIVDWASDEIRTITLTQDIGDSSYDIQVREFNPVLGDSLDRSWNSASKVHSHPCAPYAIHNMKETADVISKFVDANTETFISHYVDREEDLLWNTYWKAYDHIRETRVSAPWFGGWYNHSNSQSLIYSRYRRRGSSSNQSFGSGWRRAWSQNKNGSAVPRF